MIYYNVKVNKKYISFTSSDMIGSFASYDFDEKEGFIGDSIFTKEYKRLGSWKKAVELYCNEKINWSKYGI
jgi:hypothetical protein